MADPEHLAELNKGVINWNQWRIKNSHIVPDLRKANLSSINLRNINLSSADLSFASFRKTDLSEANLSNVYSVSTNFSGACLITTNFGNAELRYANFNSAKLTRANLDSANLGEAYLRKAFLKNANLSNAVLSVSNLSLADFSQADLSNANLKLVNAKESNFKHADLSGTQAFGTNFTGAKFTGACLCDWKIDRETILAGVECDYVYLVRQTSFKFANRYPIGRSFSSGEFAKEFKKSSEILEFIFSGEMIDFFQSFQELRQNYSDKLLAIEAVEPKGADTFVIRLEILPKTEEETPEIFYEEQRHLTETAYKLRVSARKPSKNCARLRALRQGQRACNQDSSKLALPSA
ncbi:MAG: pentapeptide repeat-containing protein [Elainellaceae cyanobacterium]